MAKKPIQWDKDNNLNRTDMNKFILQFSLVLCIIIELILVLKIFMITDVIHNALYTGSAVFIMLTILNLLTNLTKDSYGNNEKN